MALVVQRVGNVIHLINLYVMNSTVCFVNIYPLERNLSLGSLDLVFEQLRPEIYTSHGSKKKCGN